MGGYVKLYGSILQSSLWVGSDPAVKVVWITMLATADQHGVVNASVPGLAHLACVSAADAKRALKVFLSPDEDSRTKEHEGRRVEEIDGGWRLLNYQKYREMQTDKQAQTAERQRRFKENRRRDRPLPVTQVTPTASSSASSSGSSLVPSPLPQDRNGSGTHSIVPPGADPAGRLAAARAELEWRIAEVWRVHLLTRSKFWTKQNGTPGPSVELTKETRAAIAAALKDHDRERLGAEDRERWKKESPVRAAGIGLFLSSWHTGADPRNPTRYLEPWRPWKHQRGKPDPVETFAQLYFEEMAK